MPKDDDFTADEIKDFESIGDDDASKLERFLKWRGLKDANDPTRSNLKPGLSAPSPKDYTLSDLKAMVNDPEASSILRHLLDRPPASPDPTKKGQPKPGEKRTAGGLRLV